MAVPVLLEQLPKSHSKPVEHRVRPVAIIVIFGVSLQTESLVDEHLILGSVNFMSTVHTFDTHTVNVPTSIYTKTVLSKTAIFSQQD